jgi:hypothetical protein
MYLHFTIFSNIQSIEIHRFIITVIQSFPNDCPSFLGYLFHRNPKLQYKVYRILQKKNLPRKQDTTSDDVEAIEVFFMHAFFRLREKSCINVHNFVLSGFFTIDVDNH